MSIGELVLEKSKRFELFSHPLRHLITLLMITRQEIGWAELLGVSSKLFGDVNPNTLNFHLSRLIEAGVLEKIEVGSQPRYRIVEGKLPEVELMLGKDAIKVARKELSK